MKIVSKHKDYYDAGLVYWIDEKLYFKREQWEEKINHGLKWEVLKLKDRDKTYTIVIFPLIIWFCGEFYPLYKIQLEEHVWHEKTSEEIYAYSYDDFIAVFTDIWCEVTEVKNRSYYYGTSKNDALVYKDKQLDLSLSHVYNFINSINDDYDNRWTKKDYKEYKDIFLDEKVSYFIIGAYDFEIRQYTYYKDVYWLNHIVTHPILKDYKFSQIKDAYTAFQEISMFLWNMNNPDDSMLQPEDKYIAYSKWFCSHSFKKKPTKSRQKPCNKKTSLE